jgi:putative endopeptidase
MTHGIDNGGQQFDKEGDVKDWWTEEDAGMFTNQTDIPVTEYNGLEILPGLHNNGNLTRGNIADSGGLTMACRAGKKPENPSSGMAVSGNTKDRGFFFPAARIGRGNYRNNALRNQVYSDPHTNSNYRVNGALFTVPEFYEAFPEVRPGDVLYRNTSGRPVVW